MEVDKIMPFILEENKVNQLGSNQPAGQFVVDDELLGGGRVSLRNELTPAQDIYRTIEPYFEPALEMGASTAGSLFFSPLGPLGFIGGGAGGYAAAKRAEAAIEHYLGLREPTTTAQDFIDTGNDLLVGATIDTVSQGGGTFIKGLGQKVLAPEAKRMATQIYDPRLKKFVSTPEAQERLALAEKMGIEITPAEVTQSKPLALMESLLDKIAFSAGKIQDKRLFQLKELSNIRQRILKKGGSNKALEEVGLKIQEQVDDYLNKLSQGRIEITNQMRNSLLKKIGIESSFEEIGIGVKNFIKDQSQIWQKKGVELYLKAGKNIPEGTLIDTGNLQETALKFLKQQMKKSPAFQNTALMKKLMDLSNVSKKTLSLLDSLPDTQRKQLLSQIETKQDWEGLQLLIQDLNDLIRSSDFAIKQGQLGVKGLSSSEGGIYKMLKKAVIKDIDNFAEIQGGKIKTDLDLANKFWAEGKEIWNSPFMRKMLKINPEKIVDAVIKPNGVTDIKLMKRAIGRKGFNTIKNGFSNKLLNGFKDGKSFKTTLKRYGDETLEQLYSKQELSQLKQLATDDIKVNKELVANPFFRSLVKTTPEKVVSFVVKPHNTTNIDMIEKIVGKEGIKEIAAKHLERVMVLNKHDLFSPEMLVTQLRRYGDRTMNRLLTPEIWKELQQLGKVSQIARGAELIAGNPSGTAQNLITFVTGGIVLKDPIRKAWLVVAPNLLAKAYLSKPAMRYLTTGFKMPATSKDAVALFIKLSSILGVGSSSRKKEEERKRLTRNRRFQIN